MSVWTSIVSESYKNYEYEITYLNIGSDIKASGYSRSYFPELDKNITDISLDIYNIYTLTPFLVIDGHYGENIYTDYGWYCPRIALFAVKPKNYIEASNFKDKYISLESNENSILESNNIKNGTLINKDFALELLLNMD